MGFHYFWVERSALLWGDRHRRRHRRLDRPLIWTLSSRTLRPLWHRLGLKTSDGKESEVFPAAQPETPPWDEPDIRKNKGVL